MVLRTPSSTIFVLFVPFYDWIPLLLTTSVNVLCVFFFAPNSSRVNEVSFVETEC